MCSLVKIVVTTICYIVTFLVLSAGLLLGPVLLHVAYFQPPYRSRYDASVEDYQKHNLKVTFAAIWELITCFSQSETSFQENFQPYYGEDRNETCLRHFQTKMNDRLSLAEFHHLYFK